MVEGDCDEVRYIHHFSNQALVHSENIEVSEKRVKHTYGMVQTCTGFEPGIGTYS